MSIIQRIASRALQGLHEHRMRRLCGAQRTTRFQRSALVLNNSNARDAITVGAHSVVAGELLVYADSGRVDIGDYCFVGQGTRIWSALEVKIGHRVLISHNVNIHDSISHSLSARERHEHFKEIFLQKRLHIAAVPKSAIVIEDDVWIGFNVAIMPGVRIGQGAVISAGAVVNKNVPPFTVISGPVGMAIGPSLP
jgi:acetyltransferase-like isoleucine patch superfamily enzyme